MEYWEYRVFSENMKNGIIQGFPCQIQSSVILFVHHELVSRLVYKKHNTYCKSPDQQGSIRASCPQKSGLPTRQRSLVYFLSSSIWRWVVVEEFIKVGGDAHSPEDRSMPAIAPIPFRT